MKTNTDYPLAKNTKAQEKYGQVAVKNYQSNKISAYTEKIQDLGEEFNYDHCREQYWSEPELSLLFKTPLYEEASSTQKLALNHLYWVIQYNLIAATESLALLHNQITANVFFTFPEHETLCHELDLETNQERYHIKAFRSIANKTELVCLGKVIVGDKTQGKASKIIQQGFGGGVIPKIVQQFLAFNYSLSPFLACQYYALRLIANLILKNTEHRRFLYWRKLDKQQVSIPIPVSVSYYHFLDESFHTTTSGLIAQELSQMFDPPNSYEKWLANVSIQALQDKIANGVSCGVPGLYPGDSQVMIPLVYQILQTPLFDLSHEDACHWLEKCFCQENDGFNLALKYQKRLQTELKGAFSPLDHLWLSNREMSIIANKTSITQILRNNKKALEKLKR